MNLVLLSSMRCAMGRKAAFHVLRSTRKNSGILTTPKKMFLSQVQVACFSSPSDDDEAISGDDVQFMELAIKNARNGFGHTFPNPAVGCVLIRQDTNEVIGSGFHPRAGMPHAEVFALLEACGHVEDGVAAALSVLPELSYTPTEPTESARLVQNLSNQYCQDGGAENLFGKAFEDIPVTAYVTLEPCCHYGKTPPCAASLKLANVDRVVVGFRDPNPRVDGGGVKLLEDSGVQVDLLANSKAYADVATSCSELVECFTKRIMPQDREKGDYSHINGAMRSALRSLANRSKSDGSLAELDWPRKSGKVKKTDIQDNLETAIGSLHLNPTWLESVDAKLWQDEIVLIRLNNAVAKKKGAKLLGERIATELDAHIAQVVGHTALLYRADIPPVLDLNEMIAEKSEE